MTSDNPYASPVAECEPLFKPTKIWFVGAALCLAISFGWCLVSEFGNAGPWDGALLTYGWMACAIVLFWIGKDNAIKNDRIEKSLE